MTDEEDQVRARGSRGRVLVPALLCLALAVVAVPASADDVASSASPTSTPDQATSSTTTSTGGDFPALQALALPMLPISPGVDSPLTLRQRAQVLRDLSAPALGRSVRAVVADAGGTRQLSQDPYVPTTPASTLKLLTATSVLQWLGPDARIPTSVVAGKSPRSLVLVGGGDATLEGGRGAREPAATYWRPASLAQLAAITARNLRDRGVRSVSLAYDDSLFRGPGVAPSWPDEYVETGVVAPVTALMVDEGLAAPGTGSPDRVADPARDAAEQFRQLLRDRGIEVKGSLARASGPRSPGREGLATVESPPMTWLVQRMLTESDNQLAEALGRLAARAAGRPASFAGASATLLTTATSDVGPAAFKGARVEDASGLSRADRLSAALLIGLLRDAVQQPLLRPLLTSLPVAAFTGTLVDRYQVGVARLGAGQVRAKTGTLTGIDGQAGLVVDASGALRLFAFLADRTTGDVQAAREAIDAAASRLVP